MAAGRRVWEFFLNSFWTAMELHGTEEEDISGFDLHTQFLLGDTFFVERFIENKISIEYRNIESAL